MKIITRHIATLERIDQLIRLQATESPEELTQKVNISRTKLYRMIHLMKEPGGPIVYDFTIQRFIYEKEVGFRFGFSRKNCIATNRILL